MPVAIITGASRGLGRAFAEQLAGRGWALVLDGRDAVALRSAAAGLERTAAEAAGRAGHTGGPGAGGGPGGSGHSEGPAAGGTGTVRAVPGDVADPAHRAALVAAAEELGGVDLLVNNASALGAEPLVPLAELTLDGLREALEVNVVAPLALAQAVLPALRAAGGAVLNVSSDAAVEAYEEWGGYGASKAALDQVSAVLAVEEPAVRVWAVDPGDLRTALYAAAVPDDPDFAERPLPEDVAPVLLRLLDAGGGDGAASGRYTAEQLWEGR